ncbi:uncharacterized protein LOC126907269 isoform X2 [Daktulosphaira vitifoliae]|uniref:uncharacterized protein LOC126907269 isoform X2 n=1 Tax=Daktulosphaira vitifoliae TaxID=58002 RepID=UPI0021A99802|nr:uncharacterized protein LOC126907269 isoform X2 [Daktulosphaira vitifoliae]
MAITTCVLQLIRSWVTLLILLSPIVGAAVVESHTLNHQQPSFYSALVSSSVSSRIKRWSTTFGSTISKNMSNPVSIRDCTTDSDCLDTPYTSCAVDFSDRKRRCLCADGKQPQNGECLKKPRALRASCETDLECLPNAICLQNGTAANPRLKICTCKEGFIEENEACNYANIMKFNYAAILMAILTSWFWNDRLG